MKMSKPSASFLHQALKDMGMDWVDEHYSLSREEIDEILYGSAPPTPERQKKKIAKARKEDEGRGIILDNYLRDHFIWDEPTQKHIRCANAKGDVPCELSEDEIERIVNMHASLMEWDMKMNDNCMKAHGWSLGERVINKTTSLTTDDNIHDRILKYLEGGKTSGFQFTALGVKKDHKINREAKYKDEEFIDNIKTLSLNGIREYKDRGKNGSCDG